MKNYICSLNKKDSFSYKCKDYDINITVIVHLSLIFSYLHFLKLDEILTTDNKIWKV